MEYKENAELCHCKHVTLADIDRALAQTNRFSDVEREFQEVQKITSCSTGCGGCHDKIMGVILCGLLLGLARTGFFPKEINYYENSNQSGYC